MLRRTFLATLGALAALPTAVRRVRGWKIAETPDVASQFKRAPSCVVAVCAVTQKFSEWRLELELVQMTPPVPGYRFKTQMNMNQARRNGLLDVEVGDYLIPASDGTFMRRAQPAAEVKHVR